MKLSIEDLSTDRQWCSAIGYSKEKFLKLLSAFQPIYNPKIGETIETVKAKCPGETAIKACEELLLFALFSLKSGLTYDNLGFVAGMDQCFAKFLWQLELLQKLQNRLGKTINAK